VFDVPLLLMLDPSSSPG